MRFLGGYIVLIIPSTRANPEQWLHDDSGFFYCRFPESPNASVHTLDDDKTGSE